MLSNTLLCSSMELDEYQKTLLQEAPKTRGKGGFSSASSARHLVRALELKERMPEVAVFLMITAEEEAATAVFAALRKRRYEGANRLKDTDHVFKAGLYPFIQLLGNSVAAIKYNIPLELFFEPKENNPTDRVLKLRIPLNVPAHKRLCIVPDPPLNLVSVGPDGNATDYFKAVREVASKEGIDSIHEQIRRWANRRNKLLYASDSGVPEVESVEKWLWPHFNGVFVNLAAYLLIEPHIKQNFVQEALSAFLKVQSRLEARET